MEGFVYWRIEGGSSQNGGLDYNTKNYYANKIIRGDYGNGHDNRMRGLENDGISRDYYQEIRQHVNQRMKQGRTKWEN